MLNSPPSPLPPLSMSVHLSVYAVHMLAVVPRVRKRTAAGVPGSCESSKEDAVEWCLTIASSPSHL